MKFRTLNITNRGRILDEYVAFTVESVHSLSFSILLRSFYVADNAISPGSVDAFWFPNQVVKPGDNVFLFTKDGVNTNSTDPDGCTSYFFYWGRKDPVWQLPQSCAVLVDAATWMTTAREMAPLAGFADLLRPDANRST
jgi:hypothetical protein